MPYYKYECTTCNCDFEDEWDRGEQPKNLPCTEAGCKGTMEFLLDGDMSLEMEKDFSTNMTKTEQLRQNINKTENRLDELKDSKVKQGMKKWRLELNGGKH